MNVIADNTVESPILAQKIYPRWKNTYEPSLLIYLTGPALLLG
jgi:hypothetical protein